ncbi:ergot alkaloid A [Xylogone sp. PMI_703]|nr:ergot alkaloid A [Xylogone sp. PMI_703]
MSESSNKDGILLLGGTGKIARRIAPLLTGKGYTVLLASRAPKKQYNAGCEGVKFDWLDQETYNRPFNTTPVPISAIFLIPPPVPDAFPLMRAFIDIAVERNVKRIVLLSGSVLHVGDGPALAAASEYITSLGIEYALLRPTWFMENFSEMEHHVTSITEQNCIISSNGSGKLPLISADDIAEVACLSLTDERPHNTEYLLLGPELLSYDQVVEILSEHLGRRISYVKITQEQVMADLCASGMDETYAKAMSELDTWVKTGGEERLNDVVLKLTGRPPKRFEDYVQQCVKQGLWKAKKSDT